MITPWRSRSVGIALFALYDPVDLSLIEVWDMAYDDVQRLVNRNLRRNSLRWPKVREHARLRYRRDERAQSR